MGNVASGGRDRGSAGGGDDSFLGWGMSFLATIAAAEAGICGEKGFAPACGMSDVHRFTWGE